MRLRVLRLFACLELLLFVAILLLCVWCCVFGVAYRCLSIVVTVCRWMRVVYCVSCVVVVADRCC